MAGRFDRERLRHALVATAEAPLGVERSAAIAVILVEIGGSLEVLLIERATRAGDPWSGHMALPGGHVDPHDADLGATAERETLEEVGLDLRQAGERLGRLSDYSPARGVPISVRPFVYLLEARPALSLGAEVQQAVWARVEPLRAGEQQTSYAFLRAGRHIEFPAWDIEGHIVWGLTYRVLADLFRRLDQVSASE